MCERKKKRRRKCVFFFNDTATTEIYTLSLHDALPILEGLKRLEYRGYDSAGVALLSGGAIRIQKTSGRIGALEEILDEPEAGETLGIGHTRWATHGEPNTTNAHPHLDYTGKIAVVHNGIIENYGTLKTWLRNEGAEFVSETDTEVIANLIGYFYAKGDEGEEEKNSSGQNKFEWAVQQALRSEERRVGKECRSRGSP